MKRISSIVLAVLLTLIPFSIFAAPGRIAGKIYSTDIKAYINGVEVPSYSIGGKTVVILEDILKWGCSYSNKNRTLLVQAIYANDLIPGKNTYNQKPGTPIGYIYETDIKTFVMGTEISCYSLNGKMAVALEDLGNNNEYNDIGGKFIWKPTERTISLDFIHEYSYRNYSDIFQILKEKFLSMNYDKTSNSIQLTPASILYAGTITSTGNHTDFGTKPITYNDEIIGYRTYTPYLGFDENENIIKSEFDVEYFITDKLTDAVAQIEIVEPTYQDWLEYYDSQLYRIIDSFETENYGFLYMYQPTPHGSTEVMVKINKHTGEEIRYDNNFQSVSFHGQKYFDNLKIDKENEKVYFSYDTTYVINLQTDKIDKTNN